MPFTRFNLSTLLVSIPAILLCLTVHEMAHGYAAYLLGDATAKHDGRLSFNPLRHIDPIGFYVCSSQVSAGRSPSWSIRAISKSPGAIWPSSLQQGRFPISCWRFC